MPISLETLLPAGRVAFVLVEVQTDAGIVGVGETLARFSPKAYAELIETSLKPRLVGQNATDILAHWRTMRRALSGRSGGMLIEAIAGIDIALWDILGKVAGLPIFRLLGGVGRTEVPVYAASVNWGWSRDGLPIGVQLIGQRFDDIGVLRLSRAVEILRPEQRPYPE